jgi:hypothetical protein
MTGRALYNRVNDFTMSATGVDAIAHTLAGVHHPLCERDQFFISVIEIRARTKKWQSNCCFGRTRYVTDWYAQEVCHSSIQPILMSFMEKLE